MIESHRIEKKSKELKRMKRTLKSQYKCFFFSKKKKNRNKEGRRKQRENLKLTTLQFGKVFQFYFINEKRKIKYKAIL